MRHEKTFLAKWGEASLPQRIDFFRPEPASAMDVASASSAEFALSIRMFF
jgi:hypothetical protein